MKTENWPRGRADRYAATFATHDVDPDHWALTADLTGSDGAPVPVRFDCLDVVTVDPEGLVVRKDTFVDSEQVQVAVAAVT